MARKARSNEELKAISRHLHYEASMFVMLARAMATGVFGQAPINNAALESFTVHARALLDVFFGDNPREDDVVADDFLEDKKEWAKQRGKIPEALDDLRKRVGKEIAHLSYERLKVTSEEKDWQFIKIAAAFQEVFARFIKAVPKERLSEEWFTKDDWCFSAQTQPGTDVR